MKRARAALRLLAIRHAAGRDADRDGATDEELFRALHVGLRSAAVSSEGTTATAALHALLGAELGADRLRDLVAEWDKPTSRRT